MSTNRYLHNYWHFSVRTRAEPDLNSTGVLFFCASSQMQSDKLKNYVTLSVQHMLFILYSPHNDSRSII